MVPVACCAAQTDLCGYCPISYRPMSGHRGVPASDIAQAMLVSLFSITGPPGNGSTKPLK
jgi:hypothetical protein